MISSKRRPSDHVESRSFVAEGQDEGDRALLLAGEMSGHMFFKERYFGYDDAIYASFRLLEILANSGRPLSALLADLPQSVSTPEIRVDCPDDQKVHHRGESDRIFQPTLRCRRRGRRPHPIRRRLGTDPRVQYPARVGAALRSTVRREAHRVSRHGGKQTGGAGRPVKRRDGG